MAQIRGIWRSQSIYQLSLVNPHVTDVSKALADMHFSIHYLVVTPSNAHLKPMQERWVGTSNGAGERSRTPDRLITSQLLYQLSYASPNPIYKIGVAILVNVEVIINKLYVIKRFFSVFLHRSGYEREKIAYVVNFM